jgi:septum formation protein
MKGQSVSERAFETYECSEHDINRHSSTSLVLLLWHTLPKLEVYSDSFLQLVKRQRGGNFTSLVNPVRFVRITVGMKQIILASVSPQRRGLLEQVGLKFKVEPSNHAEARSPKLNPQQLARSLSCSKAKAVAVNHKNAIIIAADTFIVFRGIILGKPETELEARTILAKLSGKSHFVITGFTIIDTDENKIVSKSVRTKVHMKKLTPEEIDAYVKSKEPLDKAGAYAIQGLGSVIIEKIEGDYFNVVGLPLCALIETLKEFGVIIL